MRHLFTVGAILAWALGCLLLVTSVASLAEFAGKEPLAGAVAAYIQAALAALCFLLSAATGILARIFQAGSFEQRRNRERAWEMQERQRARAQNPLLKEAA